MTALQADDQAIARRIDEGKLTRRQLTSIGIVGGATFFDAFDALSIAYVLPVLVGLWSLTPTQIGLTISAGYAGQLLGALLFGKVAERYGRIPALRGAVIVMSAMSLVCASAISLPFLLLARFVQGIGLGGEVPVAATYVNEWSPTRARGRIVYLFQSLFALGVAMTAVIAAFVVPNWGWRALFLIGAAPAILFFVFGRKLPESPRWLASKGHSVEAHQVVDYSQGVGDAPVSSWRRKTVAGAPVANFKDLFQNGYWSRTLVAWLILFATSAVGYGLVTWLPTLYRTVYGLSLADAFRYSMLNNVLGLCGALAGAALIDRLGRKLCFGGAFLGAAAPMFVLWLAGDNIHALHVLGLTSAASFFLSVMLAGIYVYAPEIYPTRIRALGASTATAWYRLAAIVSPTVIGVLLSRADVSAVYLFFALTAFAAAAVVFLFAIETRGRPLEEIAS